MRFFKYWYKGSFDQPQGPYGSKITCYGYSDLSLGEAKQSAEKFFQIIQDKINGLISSGPDYSDIIREEKVQEIDVRNIISRNKAGALVLNSESIMILDIDDYREGILSLFKSRGQSKDEKVVNMVNKLPLAMKGNDYGMRLYKTCKGYRLMIIGNYLPPSDNEIAKIMKLTQTDPLYRQMCLKQQCYRARLTPKCLRLGMKMHHMNYPYDQQEQPLFIDWVNQYNEKHKPFGTCSLLAVRGVDMPSEVVKVHDRITRALEEGIVLK